jgi:formate hydrogenlyase subunit 6/NADH:ubiquinone oxidoreductase subunit I
MCAEACPTQCVRLTEKYDLARVTREECTLELATPKTDTDIESHKAMLARKEAERAAAAKGGQDA